MSFQRSAPLSPRTSIDNSSFAPVAIFDAVNPQSLKDFTGASFIAPRGLADFKSKSPYKDAAGMMEFIEPDQRFFVTLRAGSPENELVSTIRAFCLGSAQTNEPGFKPDRESEIAGPGYLAQDTPLLRNTLACAHSPAADTSTLNHTTPCWPRWRACQG